MFNSHKKEKGQVGLVSLIGWGLAISTFLGGIFWTKISATDSNLDNFKAKVGDDKAIYTADIAAVKTDVANIKEVVNRIDRKIK